MTCPHCKSTATSRRVCRTALGYRRFNCRSCRRRFNERTGTPFNDLHFPTDVVLLAVLWRRRYEFGVRDVTELLLQRGYEVTHETIRCWEFRLAPLLADTARALMLLSMSSGLGARQAAVKLAGDVALERADDLAFGAALGGAALDVGAGAGVVDHAHHDDAPEPAPRRAARPCQGVRVRRRDVREGLRTLLLSLPSDRPRWRAHRLDVERAPQQARRAAVPAPARRGRWPQAATRHDGPSPRLPQGHPLDPRKEGSAPHGLCQI